MIVETLTISYYLSDIISSHRQFNIAIKINPLFSFYKIRFLRFKNIRHIFLRVAVNDREPAALYLDHDPVTFFESMVDIMQVNHKLFGFVGNKWRRI